MLKWKRNAAHVVLSLSSEVPLFNAFFLSNLLRSEAKHIFTCLSLFQEVLLGVQQLDVPTVGLTILYVVGIHVRGGPHERVCPHGVTG